MDVMEVTEVKQIPKGVCNRNQSCKDLQRHPTYLTDSGHDFILDKIKHRDTIEYARDMGVDNNEECFTLSIINEVDSLGPLYDVMNVTNTLEGETYNFLMGIVEPIFLISASIKFSLLRRFLNSLLA